MFHSDKIVLTNLLANPENYRFETVSSQKEAIDNMIREQKEKLFNLAEDIMKNGLNPTDLIAVLPSSHDTSKYIVLEGNRRVICLKIIQNPDLIEEPGHANLKKKFKKLHDTYQSQLIEEIDCVVFDDPSEINKWIKLKHTGQNNGKGTVEWDTQQQERFEQTVEGKSSLAMQAIDLLKKSSSVSDILKSKLANLKSTNFNRLLNDPDVRSVFGITNNNGKLVSDVEEGEIVKGLSRIATDLLDPDFKVKDIYTKEDRRDYISKLPTSSKPNINKKSSTTWELSKGGSKVTGVQTYPAIHPTSRKHLIPTSCKMKLSNPKGKAIYYELRKMDVTKFTNAVAVSLRVFIELSLDCFIDQHKVMKTVKSKQAPVTINDNLKTKAIEIALHLEKNNMASKNLCKGIRQQVSDQHGLLGIDTFNAYVHNPRFSPTTVNLNIAWDNVQGFIEKVWENIK